MWANLFKWIQQKWWKNLHNFELGTCQLFPWCWPPWSKLRILAPWVLPWIPPWPLPYHGFSHRSHTLWVPWVLPWIPPWPLPYHGFSHRSHKLWVPWVLPWTPQLFSLSNSHCHLACDLKRHFTVLDIIYNQVEVTHASPQWGKTANVQPLRVWDLIQKDVELADAIPYWRNAVHVKCLRFYNVM